MGGPYLKNQVKVIGSNCGRSCNTVVIRHTIRNRVGKMSPFLSHFLGKRSDNTTHTITCLGQKNFESKKSHEQPWNTFIAYKKGHQGLLERKNHIFPNLAGGVVSVGHFDNHTCWLVRKNYEYMTK